MGSKFCVINTKSPLNEFIGLRSEKYLYLKDTDECGKTAKGIKKNQLYR